VLGTTYTQTGTVSGQAVIGAIAIGALACAVLVANNLRDIPTDELAGKVTLAVRLGDTGTRRLYLVLIGLPYLGLLVLVPVHPWTALALLTIPLAVPPVRTVTGGAGGLGLIPVLKDTGRLALIYGVMLAVGLAV